MSASRSAAPQISFVVASYNSRPYLISAVRSALAQQGITLEVLIVDDGSTDGSIEDARQLAHDDDRVRLLQTTHNLGPAGARNMAIDQMRGQWYAVLDSDDLLTPGRSLALLDLAELHQADLVADNLLVFGECVSPHPLYHLSTSGSAYIMGIEEYFERSHLFGPVPSPGYMKPMIRKSVIEAHKARYNEGLRIGEDDELIVRLLASGCRYAITCEPLYHYRKHAGSISHRLSAGNAERMFIAECNVRTLVGPALASSKAYRGRWKALRRGVAFSLSIEALKQRRFASAITALARSPSALWLYRLPAIARWQKITGRV
ncbi:hypothetical protein GCM10010833_33600 [Blastomonas aquatica]|uniref:Glycosyltransferase 2-like domain-containing protein n=1 Tax=Blastomonas aquatica TaxID=1510276 RepID=A0ABQ1JUI9_9SPHN|nr:hypothetical protein GCM10010833_33600 [Blastomonas aquatica]